MRTLLLFLLLCTAAWADTLSGRVVKVSDGDTITVLTAGNVPVKVRLAEIDAPENGQAFGKKAKEALAGLVAGHEVTVESSKRDRYGRVLGEVFLGPRNVNRWLIEHGWAWQYRAYSRNPDLCRLEAAARAAKRGLWADPTPVPPWEFRRAKRETQLKLTLQ